MNQKINWKVKITLKTFKKTSKKQGEILLGKILKPYFESGTIDAK